jgi:bacterioferritin-associated ferredoxin
VYVCICNAIREPDLRSAALACAGDAESVYATLGKTPQCRQCLDLADEIVGDTRDQHSQPAYIMV